MSRYYVDSRGAIRDSEETTLSGRELYQCGYPGGHHNYGQYEEEERICDILNRQ